MAYTLSTNLKLRLDSNLTANAKYNLLKLDELGGVYVPDNSGTVRIRSKVDIQFSPNDAVLGGLGKGGTVAFGAPGNRLSELLIHADKIAFNGGLTFFDQASQVENPKKLTLQYASDLSDNADTSDVTLGLDLNNANRKLVLAGDLQVLGNITLRGEASTDVTVPPSGTLLTDTSTNILTNKTIDLRYNQIIGLTPSALDPTFVLPGSSITPEFGSQKIGTSGGLRLDGPTYATTLKAATTGQLTNLEFALPPTAGNAGQILVTDGQGKLDWFDIVQTNYISSVDSTGPIQLSVTNQKLFAALNINQVNPVTVTVPSDELLVYSQQAQSLLKSTVADLFASAQFSYTIDWMSGNTFTIAHQLESLDVSVTCYEKATGATFIPDQVQRIDANTITLSATAAPPPTGWRVVIMRSGFVSGGGSYVPASPTPLHAVSLTTSASEFTVSGSSLSSEGVIDLVIDTAPQAPNTIWMGPTSGEPAKPTFRTLQLSDFEGVVGRSAHCIWYTSDGDQLVINHGFGTRNVIIQIMDNTRHENVDGPAMARVDENTVVITSDAPPPTGGWTVLLQAVI